MLTVGISHKTFILAAAVSESHLWNRLIAGGDLILGAYMAGCFVSIQTPGNRKNWAMNRKLNSESNII